MIVQSLFELGIASVLHHLPLIWQMESVVTADRVLGLEAMYDALCCRQDDAAATTAPKISAEEGNVNFMVHSAEQVHNKYETIHFYTVCNYLNHKYTCLHVWYCWRV